MGTFYYGQSSKDLKYYFRLKDGNNETILSSTEGYNTKQGCLNGIDSVKRNAPYDHNYKKFIGNDMKYYFTLHAANGEPIGKGEGYNSSYNRDRGIENCKSEAPSASLREVTPHFV
jgi:uncharacterized protein